MITLIAGGAFLGATFGPLWAVVGGMVGLGAALWEREQDEPHSG